MSTTVPSTAAAPTRSYPVPRPASREDSRFTFGLALDVAKVLEKWGYPKITSGGDFVELQQMLFLFIYGPDPRLSPAPLIETDAVALVADAVLPEVVDPGLPGPVAAAAFVPVPMPTGDADNHRTAAELRGDHHSLRYGRIRSMPVDGVDDGGGRGDAEMARMTGAAR